MVLSLYRARSWYNEDRQRERERERERERVVVFHEQNSALLNPTSWGKKIRELPDSVVW